jgi:hypothetical protein
MGVNLAIGAVGAGLNAGLNMAVAGQQEKIAAENAGMQGGLHTQAMGDVGNAVSAAAGAPAAAGGYGAYSAGQYATALAGAGNTAAAPSIAGADPRYAKANAANAGSVGSYTHALTGALSTVQGVQTSQRMAQQEAMTEATNVSALQSESYADSLVNQMRMQTVKANPLLSGIAHGMMAVGGMSSLSGLGAAPKGIFNGGGTPDIPSIQDPLSDEADAGSGPDIVSANQGDLSGYADALDLGS